MKNPQSGDIWYADLPKEENPHEIMKDRPCVVIDEYEGEYAVIKITKHSPRKNDKYDVRIKYWKECGLSYPSTARISKISHIDRSQLDNYKGHLTEYDEIIIGKKLEEFVNRFKR